MFNRGLVNSAMKAVIEYTKNYKCTPKNGWIILSGYYPDRSPIFKVIEPPLPVKKFFYRCDNKFHVDQFYDLFNTHDEYYICTIDTEFFRFYYWKGTNRYLLKKYEIDIANNSRRGGYSANRYRRNREIKKNLLWDHCIELIKSATNSTILSDRKIIICGYSEMLHEFLEKIYLYTLPIGVVKIATVQQNNIESELEHQIENIIIEYEIANKCIDLQEFNELMRRSPDLCLFGINEIIKYDREGLIKKIIIGSESNKYKFNCQNIVIISDNYLVQYGEVVGILYYPILLDDEIEESNLV